MDYFFTQLSADKKLPFYLVWRKAPLRVFDVIQRDFIVEDPIVIKNNLLYD